MADWQPIATCPEDVVVIVGTTHGWVRCAYWVLDEDTGEGRWFWDDGRRIHENFRPLGWQPLPEPLTEAVEVVAAFGGKG